jgi:hypothetical protein
LNLDQGSNEGDHPTTICPSSSHILHQDQVKQQKIDKLLETVKIVNTKKSIAARDMSLEASGSHIQLLKKTGTGKKRGFGKRTTLTLGGASSMVVGTANNIC